MTRPPRRSPLFPSTPLSQSQAVTPNNCGSFGECNPAYIGTYENMVFTGPTAISGSRHSNTFGTSCGTDRKSTRLNSSHSQISYAVFCLKKKKKTYHNELIHI